MDFERAIARHKDAVYRQMLRMCGNRDDAEDVLVESLVQAFRAKDNLRDEASFQAWLVQIGRRTCGRLKKRATDHPSTALAELESLGFEFPDLRNPEQEAIEQETRGCIESAFATLPPLYQDVYRMRELEERPAEEVAAELGITIPALKSRLHRARAMVRVALDQGLCGAGDRV